jgi:hypothetical protein
MRYATAHDPVFGQARSRRIGRCARCHAPVLADEEHYGRDDQVVHGACGAQPAGPSPPAPAAARRAGLAVTRPPRRPPIAGRPG